LPIDPWTYGAKKHIRDREFIRVTGVINRIIFPSVKMNRQVHCEGDNERNAVALLEVRPDVLEYYEQPRLGLHVESGGKSRQVYPDFELRYREGRTEIVDVVRMRQFASKEKKEKMRRIGKRCRALGYRYRIWTDVDIARQPRLATANTICWLGRRKLSKDMMVRAQECLTVCPTVGALKDALAVSTDVVCALVLQGHVSIDIECPLDDLTPILGGGWRQEQLL
jgi:hypothetical protein